MIEIDPLVQTRELNEKEGVLQILAKALIPTGSDIEKLLALIRPANEVCSLHSPEKFECPLCRQELKENELELFKKYAELLTGELDNTIMSIRKRLQVAEKSFKSIENSPPDGWAKDSVLDSEIVDLAKAAGHDVLKHFGPKNAIGQDCKNAAKAIQKICERLTESLKEKEKLVQESGKNRAELLNELKALSANCQSLSYAKEIVENMDPLKEAHGHARAAAFWRDELPVFTSALRKVTTTAKKAHKELVVQDFKIRLNNEYKALAEKEMSAFGVELKDVGGDGAVTVDHHVAGQKIEAILSEGEQRIHALALFFAELETCEQQVIVFDDPISSFDYNYIGNYCNRLRDLIQTHPNRQIIVLTHNWEFFVQIQTTLNTACLNQHH